MDRTPCHDHREASEKRGFLKKGKDVRSCKLDTGGAAMPIIAIACAALLSACGAKESTDSATGAAPEFVSDNPQSKFWENLSTLCGKAFGGVIAANVGAGAGPGPFEGKPLTMHVRECAADEIRVPFHVGEDRSRTWVFTRTPQGLRLKHDHRHADGSPDAVSLYGGDTVDSGSAIEQRFPADEYSKGLFQREGLTASIDNTWVIGIEPVQRFTYALLRPGREFRVEFDLTKPMDPPPAPWGSQ
jgi:hypothetical protein